MRLANVFLATSNADVLQTLAVIQFLIPWEMAYGVWTLDLIFDSLYNQN